MSNAWSSLSIRVSFQMKVENITYKYIFCLSSFIYLVLGQSGVGEVI